MGFDVVVCGDDVTRKKPHPEAYLHALQALGVEPRGALALGTPLRGWRPPAAAGIPVIMTRSFYFADAPGEGALARGPGLHSGGVGALPGWRGDRGANHPGRPAGLEKTDSPAPPRSASATPRCSGPTSG